MFILGSRGFDKKAIFCVCFVVLCLAGLAGIDECIILIGTFDVSWCTYTSDYFDQHCVLFSGNRTQLDRPIRR